MPQRVAQRNQVVTAGERCLVIILASWTHPATAQVRSVALLKVHLTDTTHIGRRNGFVRLHMDAEHQLPLPLHRFLELVLGPLGPPFFGPKDAVAGCSGGAPNLDAGEPFDVEVESFSEKRRGSMSGAVATVNGAERTRADIDTADERSAQVNSSGTRKRAKVPGADGRI